MGLKEEVIEMKKEVEKVKEQSLAWEMVKDAEKTNKRQFIIILVILTMWFCTIGYLIYVLNDIGVEETTTTQEISQTNENGYNNYIGNDSDIVNGNAKDKED